jgi:hypothetical protein
MVEIREFFIGLDISRDDHALAVTEAAGWASRILCEMGAARPLRAGGSSERPHRIGNAQG